MVTPNGRFRVMESSNCTTRGKHVIRRAALCEGQVFIAGRDAMTHALEPASGRMLWKTPVGAMAMSTPAYYAGVLYGSRPPLSTDESYVQIKGVRYPFDPNEYTIQTVRPDMFAPGYYSLFDVILAVAQRHGIAIDYEYDAAAQTHWIKSINGVPGSYWHHWAIPITRKRKPNVYSASILEDWDALERGFSLQAPCPGTFSQFVAVSYNMLEPGTVDLSVQNALGERIETLVNEPVNDLGVHTLTWEPRNRPSGMYNLVMTCHGFSQTRSVTYVK